MGVGIAVLPLPWFTWTMDVIAIGRDARARFGPFIREVVNPGAEQRDRDGITFPRELLREALSCGLWTVAMPARCGGGGADPLTWGITLEQLGYLADDGSFPLSITASIHRARSPARSHSGARPR